jgi:hypothetical protein
VVLQVWDVNVIETAMKDFYGNDQSTMIQAIQQNITVRTEMVQVQAAFALLVLYYIVIVSSVY